MSGAGFSTSDSRRTFSGEVPYSSWTIALIVSITDECQSRRFVMVAVVMVSPSVIRSCGCGDRCCTASCFEAEGRIVIGEKADVGLDPEPVAVGARRGSPGSFAGTPR